MDVKKVVCEIKDGLAVVTLNNPPFNALNAAVMSELDHILDDLASNHSVQVVIMTGAGEKAFVAGADIKQFTGITPASGKELVRLGHEILSKIKALDQPVIAAIHGLTLGGGCELALACDLRIASENALLGFPEVSLGILPGYGGTQRLPRLIGPSRAMALICTGDPIKADEAFRIGLVDKLAPVGQVLEEAKLMANKIMSRAPLAVQAAKKAILTGVEMTFEEGLMLEADLFASLCGTDDQKEGAEAFLSKRKPVFVGK